MLNEIKDLTPVDAVKSIRTRVANLREDAIGINARFTYLLNADLGQSLPSRIAGKRLVRMVNQIEDVKKTLDLAVRNLEIEEARK